MNIEETNLESALKKFIHAIRIFVSSEMKDKYGDSWERKYFETLNEYQQKIWTSNRSEADHIRDLIDFGNLSSLAKNTGFFKNIVRNGWKYRPKLNDINEARNMIAHYSLFDEVKSNLAFAQMTSIAKELGMIDLEKSLKTIQKNQIRTKESSSSKTTNKIINKTNLKQRPKLKKVINFILNTTGINIDKANANLSTINSNNKYSVEPNFNRKNNNWHLILINPEKKIIYIFNIPSNHNVYSKLYQRNDKSVFRLLFDVDNLNFIEQSSQERFDVFLDGKASYDDDSLIF